MKDLYYFLKIGDLSHVDENDKPSVQLTKSYFNSLHKILKSKKQKLNFKKLIENDLIKNEVNKIEDNELTITQLHKNHKLKGKKLKRFIDLIKDQKGRGIFDDIKHGFENVSKLTKKTANSVINELSDFVQGKTALKPSQLTKYLAMGATGLNLATSWVPGLDVLTVPGLTGVSASLGLTSKALEMSGRGIISKEILEYIKLNKELSKKILLKSKNQKGAGNKTDKIIKIGKQIYKFGSLAYKLFEWGIENKDKIKEVLDLIKNHGKGLNIVGQGKNDEHKEFYEKTRTHLHGRGSSIHKKYYKKNGMIVGNKLQVWDINSPHKITSGGLLKEDLMKNKRNKIISKKMYERGINLHKNKNVLKK